MSQIFNDEDFFDINLNESQLKAVNIIDRPLRIIAGPGTGKTRTIVSKVLFLIEEKNIRADKILIITFTNKAKQEIIERITKKIGNQFLPNIFTYHSFASYFLRIEFHKINNEFFKIFDAYDQIKILKDLQKEHREFEDIKPNELLSYSAILNEENEEQIKVSKKLSLYYKLYILYQDYKKKHNGFDFDDLLIETNKILENYPEIKEKWIRKYEYIFLDEFQDTNDIQFKIIQNITTRKSKITVVGDPDQNMYSWRGANIEIILNLPKYYDDMETIFLSQNYRSTPEILNVAKLVISKNKNRIDHDLFTRNPHSDFPIKIYEFNSSQQEAKFVSETIKELLKEDNKLNPNDIAIIYRSNFVSREFESSFLQNGIKYKVIGGFKFYDRKEVKEAIHLIGFLIFDDNFYFESTISVPPKGIGEKTLQAIIEKANLLNLSYFDALLNLREEGKFQTSKITNFIEVIEKYRLLLKENKITSIEDYFINFIDEIGLYEYYELEGARQDNISEVIKDLSSSINLNNIESDLIEFLQKVSLMSSSDEQEEKDQVILITAHSSKGTEFKVVFVVALSEGVFPSSRSIYGDHGELEEERRSFYVAVSRAKEKLYFTYHGGYNFDGTRKLASSFLNNLELEKVARSSFTFTKNYSDSKTSEKMENYFKDNSSISTGSNIIHSEYGEGHVLEDLDKYIRVAFDKRHGIKTLVKNHISIKVI